MAKHHNKTKNTVKPIYSYAVFFLAVGVYACVSYFSGDDEKPARRNAAPRSEQVQSRTASRTDAEVVYGTSKYVQDGDSLLFIPRGENSEEKVRFEKPARRNAAPRSEQVQRRTAARAEAEVTARRNAAPRSEQVQRRTATRAEAEVICGRCKYVQDGDSLLFIPRGENTEVKVRLFGVDAPERNQAWADESRDNLRGLVGEQEIRLQVVDVDQYGRRVAKVYAGETYVNLEQLKAGMAWLYERFCDPEEDADLISAAQSAQNGRVGLWSDSSALNPREHRRRYGTVHDGR